MYFILIISDSCVSLLFNHVNTNLYCFHQLFDTAFAPLLLQSVKICQLLPFRVTDLWRFEDFIFWGITKIFVGIALRLIKEVLSLGTTI